MHWVVPAYFASVAALVLFGLHRLFLLGLFARVRRTRPAPANPPVALPRVTVQLPLYNEPCVAGRLLRAVARLDYPRTRLDIQVLDDSDDGSQARVRARVARLQRAGIPIQHVRRAGREQFKAGALAHGLRCARGELVAIFDADFVPPRDFLRRVVPRFADPRVGMVQARWEHLNRDYSLLTTLQSIFLDGHFLIEHIARARSGRFFNFNGTGGVWRRECIDAAGGWQGDTLTEDLDLSYRAQLCGWRFEYLDDLTTPGELPIEMTAFKSQQHRWAKGGIQTARKLLPRVWRSAQPWPVKLEATLHLSNNLAYLLMAVPCLLWVPTLAARHDADRPLLLAITGALSLTTASVVTYHAVSQWAAGRSAWRSVLLSPALLALGLGLSLNNGRAVVEALLGRRSGFCRTPKYGVLRRGDIPARHQAAGRNAGGWWELALAVYFAAGVVVALQQRRLLALPFLALCLCGFAYVGLASLGRKFDRLLSAACLLTAVSLVWACARFLTALVERAG